MSFAAPVFLWYFMPTVLLLYWVLPRHWRNGLISVASLVFYTWGAGELVVLLLSCMVINYAAGLAVDARRLAEKQKVRRSILWTAVTVNLGILAIWKYAGFFSQQAHNIADAFGWGDVAVLEIALPIGISFYTFQAISYVIDVYRRSRPAQKSPVQFITYIGMFPPLVAGPIVRYHEISEQLADTSRNRLADFSVGFPRFALGLSKKVIIADSVGPVADACFAVSNGDMTTKTAWLGVIAYTVQIYFDFSGYSDMAIGLGRMFGFQLPENFDRPYSANSITDFWRRWHITLSSWFRDYVYIPLGGNRDGAGKTYRNLLIIFLLTGIWHGANWTFIVWGMFHGACLVVERLTGMGRRTPKSFLETIARRALTMFLVMIGWVFFRAQNIEQAWVMLKVMFIPTGGPVNDIAMASVTNQRTLVLALGCLVVLMPATLVMGRLIQRYDIVPAAVLRAVVLFILAPYAAIAVAAGTFSPFLYFQF